MPTPTALDALQYVKDPTTLEYGDTSTLVRMAQEHPVVHAGDLWFLFANDAARWALSCPALVVPPVAGGPLSAAGDTNGVGTVDLLAGFLPVQHPDDHRRLRRGITPLLAARRLDDLAPQLVAVATDVLDGLIARGRVDLVEHAVQLAGLATSAALGVAPQDRPLVLRWADLVNRDITRAVVASTPEAPSGGETPGTAPDPGPDPLSPAELVEVERIVEQAVERLLVDTSPAAAPTPGASACPHAGPSLAHDLSHEEAVALARMTFMGGLDTVVAGVCGALHLLDEHRDVLTALRTGVLGAEEVVAEAVRCLPPFPFVHRAAAGPADALRYGISVGESVVVVLGAANHDPRVFEEPAAFLPGRDQRHSLAFGRGRHHCIGQGLAERVTAAFLEQFAARVQDFSVEGPLRPRRGHSAGGPERMVVHVS